MTPETMKSPATAIELPVPTVAPPRPRGRRAAGASSPAQRSVSLEQLSAMLWAGFGPDRHGSGGRSPWSPNQQPRLDLYALLPQGSYRYDSQQHRLELASPRDLRAGGARPLAAASTALGLVYVADCEGFEGDQGWEECGVLAGVSAAGMAGNIAGYCATTGLAASNRRLVDPDLAQELHLKPTQRIVLVQAVGYPPRGAH